MKRAVKLVVSLVITVACTWWTFKDTMPGTPRWEEMVASLRSANYLWLIPYFGLLVLIHLCRTLRWGNLLSGIEKVPFRALNEASAIGFMMLIVLPFRLGEFARPFLIAQRSGIRRSAAMTSVVLERIADGITIAVLLRVLMFFMPAETDEIRHVRLGANLMFVIFGGGLCFLLFAHWQRQRAVALVRATAGRVSPRIAEKVAEIVDTFVGALRQLPNGRNIAGFVLFSAGYWALNGLGMSLLANAFDCSLAGASVCAPLQLTVFQGYVVLAVLVVGLMIPAAPGSAGTFQAFVLLAISIFLPDGVWKTSGVAYAWVLWMVQMAQQLSFGLIFLLLGKQSFQDIAGNLNKQSKQADAADAKPA